MIAKAQCSINFSRSSRNFCNGINNFLFANATKIYQFKANDFEIKNIPLCLRTLSKDFIVNNIKKQY